MASDNTLEFRTIDSKQQERWDKASLFKTPAHPGSKKFYCLDMFPYPSGAGLHVGHPEGYTASDIISRYKRMNGFAVLHPMGWDAFGLPAENYAIETGIHPGVTTRKNIDTFRRQIRSLGLSYDWEREIDTTDPEYYRWTQWIFLQLYKKGLAYQSTIPINWCQSCKTGLANEEVFNGKCERCGGTIEQKKLPQWILKITAYADRLLEDLDGLDWPESTLLMQRNWIGRSEGAEIAFPLDGTDKSLLVFTTRPDTIYGATYMVIAPEHPLVDALAKGERRAAVLEYVSAASKKTEFERSDISREKTGVFTGSYALNPLSGAKVPVWVADYVLAGYGTGAIMAVPAHDERDWEFSKKFELPVITVVKAPADYKGGALFTGDGTAINSELINGLSTPEAKKRIIAHLEGKGIGRHKITYKLRDWVFSRQRYWGEPIPIVHCPKCGVVPLPESELPLRLPDMKKFEPSGTGESPLANAGDWLKVKCPTCGGEARRETNTMPQWAGSCWYYLRFADPRNSSAPCSREMEKAWLPVDCYIGGSEHAVLHLLYARFWHKVLFDLGVVSSREPFTKLRHQGMILSYSYRDAMGVYHPYGEIDFAESGPKLKKNGEALTAMVEKMSKSKKNVVNPDDIIHEYGADAFRMYEMFMGPFDASKPWDMKGIEGISRFLKRVWYWAEGIIASGKYGAADAGGRTLESLRHKTIAKVSADIEHMHFNTAVSALMIYFNELSSAGLVPAAHLETFLTLLHPLAPHITEELWQRLRGGDAFLSREKWPQADPALLQDDELDLGVQVNGKLRGRVKVPAAADEAAVKAAALENENVKRFLEGKTVVKVIVVPKKMVSIVVK